MILYWSHNNITDIFCCNLFGGHSWSFMVTRGHSLSIVVTRVHSWSLVHEYFLTLSRGTTPKKKLGVCGNSKMAVISQDSLSSFSPITHYGQMWVFFLPLTSQRRLQSSAGNEIWHEYSLRNSSFNGSSLTSWTETVTSQLTLISDTKM